MQKDTPNGFFGLPRDRVFPQGADVGDGGSEDACGAQGGDRAHASTATPASSVARAQKTIRSVGAISKNIVARNLVNATEPRSPAPTPITIVSAPCASTIPRDVGSTSLFGS